MAILFSQADGSDQHYDTYEEFEQAMILMKRLNGEEVPQDLLDEAKEKYGDKEIEPFKVQIDGENFESAVKEATREFAEALDEIAKDRTPVSDKCENPKKEAKFNIGDKIKVVKNTSSGHVNGTIGEIVGVEYFESENKWTYVVHPISDYLFEQSLRHEESDLELFNDDIEVGDKVRIVSSDDGTDTPYHYLNVGSVGKVVGKKQFGGIVVEEDGRIQCLLPHHYEKVEPLGKDANGEDLYKGDVVTGTEDNDYGCTNSTVDMEVLGEGSSFMNEKANIRVRIVGESGTYGVDSSKFVKLSDGLDEAKDKFDEINGEGESELLPVGTKVRLLRPSTCGDLLTGDAGTITDIDERCPMGLVYSVRVRSGEDGYGWVKREDVEVVEDEQEFKVGDKVRVVGNAHGHWMDPGEVREIKSVDSKEPKYNLSDVRSGFWAGTSDIEHVRSSTKFRTGDVVKVTESF